MVLYCGVKECNANTVRANVALLEVPSSVTEASVLNLPVIADGKDHVLDLSTGLVDVDDTTLKLSELSADAAPGSVLYDLTGRRINSVGSHGLYIVNGKKVRL